MNDIFLLGEKEIFDNGVRKRPVERAWDPRERDDIATTKVPIDSHGTLSRPLACGRHFSVPRDDSMFVLCGPPQERVLTAS